MSMDRSLFAKGQIPAEFVASAGANCPRFEAQLAECEREETAGWLPDCRAA